MFASVNADHVIPSDDVMNFMFPGGSELAGPDGITNKYKREPSLMIHTVPTEPVAKDGSATYDASGDGVDGELHEKPLSELLLTTYLVVVGLK